MALVILQESVIDLLLMEVASS
jgi:hypothetical protein